MFSVLHNGLIYCSVNDMSLFLSTTGSARQCNRTGLLTEQLRKAALNDHAHSAWIGVPIDIAEVTCPMQQSRSL